MSLLQELLLRVKALVAQMNWRKMLKAYGVFAVLHSLFKIIRIQLKVAQFRKMTAHLPGQEVDLTAKPLIENMNRMNDWWVDIARPHEKEALVRLPMPDRDVLVNSPAMVKFILKDEFKHFTKPSGDQDYLFELLEQFIGRGIFALRHGPDVPKVEHDKWNTQRKVTSRIFTKSIFNSMMDKVFVNKAKVLVDHLKGVCERNADSIGGSECLDVMQGCETVDMQNKFFCFTFDSIQKIFFGVDVNTVGTEEDPYANAFDRAHRAMMLHMFASSVPMIAAEAVLPFPFGTPGFKGGRNASIVTQLSKMYDPNYQNFLEAIEYLDKVTFERISAKRAQADLSTSKDMISNFMNADPNLTDQELRDIILNLIIAGRDTTACTLTWMFFNLAKDQKMQSKLFDELSKAGLGMGPGQQVPCLENVSADKLPYLNGVMWETLRLHGAVPQDIKIATRDVSFPDGTTLPEGCRLSYSPYVMARNRELWGQDAAEFKPERWIDETSGTPLPEPDMFKMPTFQAGNRFCLGKDMAKHETKVLAACLLSTFSFHFAHSSAGRPLPQPSDQTPKTRMFRAITEAPDVCGFTDPENVTYALAITMSLCDALDQSSHHLYLVPKLR